MPLKNHLNNADLTKQDGIQIAENQYSGWGKFMAYYLLCHGTFHTPGAGNQFYR